ncbi:MAG: right-handed parallel beta-helix repeat-containing protein [Thermoclostridium sp.]|nr:right-handed parallel beta-helix repeat-containing protein [Thermoclostridium sp.]
MNRKFVLMFLVFILVFASCGKKQKGNDRQTGSEVKRTGVVLHDDTASPDEENSMNPVGLVSPEPSITQPLKQTEAKHPALTPSAAKGLEPVKEKPTIDYQKLNSFAASLQKEGKDIKAILFAVADNLWKYFKYNDMLLDVAVDDINRDSQDEIVLLYRNENNEGSITSILQWKDGRLETDGEPISFDAIFTQISPVDLITGGTLELCFTDDCYEYPEFLMLRFGETGWEEYNDLTENSLGQPMQFLELSYDSIKIGHRITSGLYSWTQYQWNGEQFDAIDQYSYDSRILYKLDEMPVTEYDLEVPVLVGNTVIVSDIFEFVSVLGSDRTIQMKPGVYDFDKLNDAVKNTAIEWENSQYFSGLRVKDIQNLTIEALEEGTVEIVSPGGDVIVMTFLNCRNLTFKNLILGHGFDSYEDEAQVLRFSSCSDISLQNCTLYKGGTYGFTADNCKKLSLSNSIIEECSHGAARITDSEDIVMDGCDLRNNRGDSLLSITSSKHVELKDTLIQHNHLEGFISEPQAQMHTSNLTFQYNNFSQQPEYNGVQLPEVPILNTNWEETVKQVFQKYTVVLSSAIVRNEDGSLVFSVDLPSGFIDNKKSFLAFINEIAQGIGYCSFGVVDDNLKASIRVNCSQEQQNIYSIDYKDTEEYHQSSLFCKENYAQLDEVRGQKLPVKIVEPDTVSSLGKPFSFSIFTEREMFNSAPSLNLAAIYGGNRVILKQTGYYPKWSDLNKAYEFYLPQAFSNNLLMLRIDEEILIVDIEEDIIALLRVTRDADNNPINFIVKAACQLKQGTLEGMGIISGYTEGESEYVAFYRNDRLYKVDFQTLEAVEKNLYDWQFIPNSPSGNLSNYSAECLQRNQKTGVLREYSIREDSWTYMDYEFPDDLQPIRKSDSFIISKSGSTYEIMKTYPSGQVLFRNKDDDGQFFQKEIIDVFMIQRPGAMCFFNEPCVLFDDLSSMVLESNEYWSGYSNWFNLTKSIGKVNADEKDLWREVGRCTEGFVELSWQVRDSDNLVRKVRLDTGDIFVQHDLSQTPVKGEVAQILHYLDQYVFILTHDGGKSTIYQAKPDFTGFISCNQYGDQDIQDEFAGAIPNEPFSKIDSIRFVRSAYHHAYYSQMCLEISSKTASIPTRLLSIYWDEQE